MRQFQSLPERQQWLIVGSFAVVALFAILYWTRVGNRRIAIKCLVVALVFHVLAWGYAHEYHLQQVRAVSAQVPRVPVRLKPVDRSELVEPGRDAWTDPRTLPAVIAPEEVVEKKVAEPDSPERRVVKEESEVEVPARRMPLDDPVLEAAPTVALAERSPVEADLHILESPRPALPESVVPPPASPTPPIVEEIIEPRRSTPGERVVRRRERPNSESETQRETPTPITVPPKNSEDAEEMEVSLEPRGRELAVESAPLPGPPISPLPAPDSLEPTPPRTRDSSDPPASAQAPISGLRMTDEILARRKPSEENPVRRREKKSAEDEELAIPRVLPEAGPANGGEELGVEMAAVWRNRTAPDRLDIVFRHGGSIETERAVAEALAWLEIHQDPRGFWDSDGFMRRCPPGDPCTGPAVETGSDNGLTGLALLAFLGAGHTHLESPKHRETMRRGLSWLMEVQQPDGDLRGNGRIYDHAMATLSLSEAYAMTKDERLLPATRKAVNWLVRAQHPQSGGWRYAPGQFGDTSVFGWVILALRSARNAGIVVPKNTWDQSRQWLELVSLGPRGGLACYRPGNQPSHAMTAEALVCRQIFGLPRNDPRMDEAGDYLLARLPDPGDYHLYYWYYGTIAMFQLGGDHWDRWNDRLSRTLLATQRTSGHARGSWDPLQPFGIDGGRVFSTACSALCLEVYYRYLPLYSTSGRGNAPVKEEAKQP